MTDEDPNTIDHNKAEPTPEGWRYDNRVFTLLAVFVAFMWYLQYQYGEPFNWVQIMLGFVTAIAILLPIAQYTDPNKPYLDYFKRDID